MAIVQIDDYPIADLHGDIHEQVGVLRVEPRDLQLPAGSPFSAEAAAFEGWFMDIILEDSHWQPDTPCATVLPCTLPDALMPLTMIFIHVRV